MKKSLLKKAIPILAVIALIATASYFVISAQAATGDVWITPTTQTIANGSTFTTQVHVNSGTQKLAAYGIDITFNSAVVNVDTSVGTSGVTAGPDGFIAAVNAATAGKLTIAGFDTAGKGPGTDLNILTINWKAVGSGTATLAIKVNSLVDASTANIGTLNGISATVTVPSPATPTPATKTPTPATKTPTPATPTPATKTPTPATPTPATKTPTPATKTPTPATPTPSTQGGAVWLTPTSQSVASGGTFTTQVHVNSGTAKLAAYGIDITFDSTKVAVNTAVGTSGVTAGADGFVSAVNPTTGKLTIAGFDTSGKGPGTDLNILTISWKAVGTGTATLTLTVNNLVDPNTATIGTPKGTGATVTISGTPTPTTTTPTPTKTPTPTTTTPTPTTTTGGNVWITPVTQTVSGNFTTQVHVNSGSQKLAAYGIVITFDSTKVAIDTSVGTSGVTAGPDGFVAAANPTTGQINIAGFDASGKGPGTDLNILTINWKAVANGTVNLGLTVNSLVDANSATIGTPKGTGATVTVSGITTTTTPTPATKTPTPSTPTPTSQGTANAGVQYIIQNDWGAGATISINIKNTGSAAINGWTLKFSFSGNQKLSGSWCGNFTQSGTSVTVTNLDWNKTIAAGQTINIGFNISYSGTNAKPTSFTINGSAAQVL